MDKAVGRRLRAPKFICANMNQVSMNITHDCVPAFLLSPVLLACCVVEHRIDPRPIPLVPTPHPLPHEGFMFDEGEERGGGGGGGGDPQTMPTLAQHHARAPSVAF